MTLLNHGAALGLLLSLLYLPSSIPAAETSAPPANVEYVPVPQACTLGKHPALPVLYVGCYGFPGQRNLITFQLGHDGSIATNTMKVCDDYFSVDGKKPE